MSMWKRQKIQKMLRTRSIGEGDYLIDSYEIKENLKKFNNILAEVGGSL